MSRKRTVNLKILPLKEANYFPVPFKGASIPIGLVNYPPDIFEKNDPEYYGDGIKGVFESGYYLRYEGGEEPYKLDLNDYLSMDIKQKDRMYENISPKIKDLASENLLMGIIFKKALDEKYGEGRYKFVSIGTSPACIAKAMELMGEDVVYLPMSFSKDTIAKSWLDKSPYVPMYKDFLDSKGLTNKALKDENKTAVVCDFVSTGRSLELAEYMLTNTFKLDKERVETLKMNDVIGNSSDLCREYKEQYLSDLLRNEKLGDFCEVPHFNFLDKRYLQTERICCSKDLINMFNSYVGPHSNKHNFCLMRLLDELELLKKPVP